MKELRFFYTPDPSAGQLPADEAQHALRVLRLQMGDELHLMDGQGAFYRAVITEAGGHHCRYRIEEILPQHPEWQGTINLAVAPTKNMDRMEWFTEKATEIGIDRLSLLDCRFSERNVVTDSLRLSSVPRYTENMIVTNNNSTFTASFVSSLTEVSLMTSAYGSTSVPSGWLVPFSYIKVGRPAKENERVAEVNLIIPHTQGHSYASQNVTPYFYNISFQRGL